MLTESLKWVPKYRGFPARAATNQNRSEDEQTGSLEFGGYREMSEEEMEKLRK